MQAAPKIIYINLDSRSDRREFMEGQLNALGVDYERFPAVVPSIESIVEPDGAYYSYFDRAGEQLRGYALNPKLLPRAIGVFGCYLSHLHIHQKAALEGWAHYIVLEDDCIVTEDALSGMVHSVLEANSFPDWDLVRNCSTSDRNIQKFDASHRKSRFSDPENHHRHNGGAYACLFNGSSVNKLLKLLEEDYVFNIDGLYSTDRLNSYHYDFGFRHAEYGTNIPKLEDRPFGKRVALRLKGLASRLAK